jgi:hypothetical protein
VGDKVNDDAKAREALCSLQESLDSARLLVKRTRSLLNGEIAYDEGEMAMIAAETAATPPPDMEPEIRAE